MFIFVQKNMHIFILHINQSKLYEVKYECFSIHKIHNALSGRSNKKTLYFLWSSGTAITIPGTPLLASHPCKTFNWMTEAGQGTSSLP